MNEIESWPEADDDRICPECDYRTRACNSISEDGCPDCGYNQGGNNGE